MGCLTGAIAKLLLTSANLVMAALAAGGVYLGMLIAKVYRGYGDWVPSDALTLLNCAEGAGLVVLVLAALGVITVCCCHNKTVLGTYSTLGVLLAAAVITISAMGFSRIDRHDNGTYNAIMADVEDFYTLGLQDRMAINEKFADLKCCGANNYTDFAPLHSYELPPGCCGGFNVSTMGRACVPDNAYILGCYDAITIAYGLAYYLFLFGCLFGLAMLVLLVVTFVLIKCTDAMPI